MLRDYRKRFGVITAAVALFALGVTPASAAPLCPGTRVPAFESPDVTLTPEPNTSMTIWSSSVTVLAFCEDLGNPADFSMPLSGINIPSVALVNFGGISDLQISISADGTGPFVSASPGTPIQIATPGVVSDATGHASFVMRATSVSTPFLGGPDGTPRFIGMHFDGFAAPLLGGSPSAVMPDEGLVFAQTPELDSLLLFGSGAVGLAGYGLTRLRARRRE